MMLPMNLNPDFLPTAKKSCLFARQKIRGSPRSAPYLPSAVRSCPSSTMGRLQPGRRTDLVSHLSVQDLGRSLLPMPMEKTFESFLKPTRRTNSCTNRHGRPMGHSLPLFEAWEEA